jgi:DNA-binding transcriptional MerR regulator
MTPMEQSEEQSLSSGQLAAAAGVSADTLRHYERIGVLAETERSPNGYRRYPPAALQRVRMIRSALAVGFTLEELAGILRERQAGTPPCRRVHAMASEKLADIERRIVELTGLRDSMRSVLERWRGDLATTPEGQPAHLLEKLSVADSSSHPLRSTDARPHGAAPFSIRSQKEKS